MYIFWVDTETTGLNSFKNGIVSIAGLIEKQGNIIDEFYFKTQPHEGDVIDDRAMTVNGISPDELATFESSKKTYERFISLVDTYVDKFNKKDKMVLAGYNVDFDKKFLSSWFRKNKNNYFFSYFYGMSLDVGSYVVHHCAKHNLKLDNHKLATVAQHFKIEAKFHDAMDDIVATRKLFEKLEEA